MAEESITSVSAAFEILLEEIEEEVDLAKQTGSEAFANDLARVPEAFKHAQQLEQFRNRVSDLQREWEKYETVLVEDDPADSINGGRTSYGRVPRGSRTPHRAFYRPILQVVADQGGSARAGDVVDAIEPLMKDVLKEIEYTSLPSQPDQPRWRNRAHWVRHQLVREGMLKDDSPHGTWEITEEGRQFLTTRPGS